MNRPIAGTVAGSLITVGVLVLAGCSSSGTSGQGAVASTSDPPSPRPPSASASSPDVSPTVPSPPAATPLVTDDGAALTPTGTTLRVGRSARVRYELDLSSKQTSVLSMAVTRVRRGTITDLSRFELDAQTKTGVPFYVTATFRNVGDKTVKPSGIFGTINALNGAGDKVTSLALIGDFPKCGGLAPQSLPPGKSFTECQVYVAPAGQRVGKVVYDHFLQLDETKITWSV